MKKFALLSSFLLIAGVASAAPSAKSTHHSKSKDSAKATTAAKTAAPAELAGEVVSVDAAKKTVTFKNDKGETLTWPVEGAAADSLKMLKAGDKVAIGYAVDANGAPKAITSIKTAPAAK